mmetsp:Transcript_130969/g.365000  ORF Transcript_130969/g.365000 Transcript_130969/m.365000 type:complete len:210 (-) Transcript_130969:713-1342(-)
MSSRLTLLSTMWDPRAFSNFLPTSPSTSTVGMCGGGSSSTPSITSTICRWSLYTTTAVAPAASALRTLVWNQHWPRFTRTTAPSKRPAYAEQPSTFDSTWAKVPSLRPKPVGLKEPPTAVRRSRLLPPTRGKVSTDSAHVCTVFSHASPSRDVTSSCLLPSGREAAASEPAAQRFERPPAKRPRTMPGASTSPLVDRCNCRTRQGQQSS